MIFHDFPINFHLDVQLRFAGECCVSGYSGLGTSGEPPMACSFAATARL